MGDFVNKLRELGVEDDGVVTMSYSEGCDVWHINESYVEESVGETATVGLLAGLLVSPVPVYSTYSQVSEGNDILNDMRGNDLLDDYERGEEYFEEYIAEKLAETVYDQEYSIEYSTTQYDYKRGRCDISTEVKVRAGDLYAADASKEGRYSYFSVDNFVRGFNVSVETKNGTLTLN